MTWITLALFRLGHTYQPLEGGGWVTTDTNKIGTSVAIDPSSGSTHEAIAMFPVVYNMRKLENGRSSCTSRVCFEFRWSCIPSCK